LLISLEDKVLWALGSSGGKLSISRLSEQTELTKAELYDILAVLEREVRSQERAIGINQ